MRKSVLPDRCLPLQSFPESRARADVKQSSGSPSLSLEISFFGECNDSLYKVFCPSSRSLVM